ncbi:MAG: hypothetical protein WBD22_14300 [Pyrinomonadaceae bacterium]
MFDGEKLKDAPDEVGVELEQLTAQHNRDACAAGVLSLLFALSQHFIICPRGACSGVPANTPPARAESKKSNVSLFTIKFEYMARSRVKSTTTLPKHNLALKSSYLKSQRRPF